MGKRLCFIVICCVFGYMDILAQSVLPDSVAVVYVDSLKLWEERMLSTDGRLYSVTHYSDSLLTKQEGSEIYFFSNGTVKSTAMYRNGELSDTVQAWYYDRSVKRRDVYENGRLVEGVCYGPRGGTLTHTDYRKDTEYKGGIPALYSVIAINAQKVVLPDDEPAKQGKVIVRLSIDKRGRVYDKHVVQSLHPLYDAEVLRICEHLEQFEPALRDGEAVPCFYLLTVLF
ncbi:MAG: energy transducer TonB [Bacteroidales bacterium]|nr:energy transducer TonB [Bacteroidales bacterium]